MLTLILKHKKKFLTFIYCWESVSRGGAERGRHRIQSRLQALNYQHSTWCGARTREPQDHDLSQSRTLNQMSHPGAPTECTYGCICRFKWHNCIVAYDEKLFWKCMQDNKDHLWGEWPSIWSQEKETSFHFRPAVFISFSLSIHFFTFFFLLTYAWSCCMCTF